MITKAKLTQLEKGLSIIQHVNRLLDHMAQFETMDDYIHWAYGHDVMGRITQLRKDLASSIEGQIREKDKHLKRKQSIQKHREFRYLYGLALWPCQKLEQDRYKFMYCFATLLYHNTQVLYSDTWKDDFRIERAKDSVTYTQTVATSTLTLLYTHQEETKALSQKYFDGRPLHFQDQATWLQGMIENTETIVANFNGWLEILEDLHPNTHPWQDHRVDPEAIHTDVMITLPRRLEIIQQEAKIDLYESEGNYEKGIKLFQEWV